MVELREQVIQDPPLNPQRLGYGSRVHAVEVRFVWTSALSDPVYPKYTRILAAITRTSGLLWWRKTVGVHVLVNPKGIEGVWFGLWYDETLERDVLVPCSEKLRRWCVATAQQADKAQRAKRERDEMLRMLPTSFKTIGAAAATEPTREQLKAVTRERDEENEKLRQENEELKARVKHLHELLVKLGGYRGVQA